MRVIDIVAALQDMAAQERRLMYETKVNPLINDIFAVERAAIRLQAIEDALERIRLLKMPAKEAQR